ncbi:MAG: glycosyltransferase family 2 protein [Candidatus Omnitrophica bacterium]|nr:glycosyltransferase family 2 protein [Candidatus Omnitrophota bacterium]MBU0895447.1 glycosyltransferase family 2 protein [Candidatus Omnitrophota bacterium]MBU1807938.1 glycosyltransferase family 2 protein [Candidatus Omnitrophota bacterium]
MIRETLSVVIITKDEEANIRECLEGVKWADEIVIVDDMSLDRTVTICREYTDKIFFRKMDGFGAQKQYGIDKATGDWVLSLDADERLSPELENRINGILEAGSHYAGYRIRRKTFYLGVWIRHCGWYNSAIRLFRRGGGRSDMRYVHESIVVSGNVGEIMSPMSHYSYKSIDQHVKKLSVYTDHEARGLYEKGIRISGARIIWLCGLKPFAAFIRKYLFMSGFLDGIRGLIISFFTAFAVFLNYAKVWQIQKNTGPKDP